MNKSLESDEWFDWIHSWSRHRGKRLKQDWQSAEYSERKKCRENIFSGETDLCEGGLHVQLMLSGQFRAILKVE